MDPGSSRYPGHFAVDPNGGRGESHRHRTGPDGHPASPCSVDTTAVCGECLSRGLRRAASTDVRRRGSLLSRYVRRQDAWLTCHGCIRLPTPTLTATCWHLTSGLTVPQPWTSGSTISAITEVAPRSEGSHTDAGRRQPHGSEHLGGLIGSDDLGLPKDEFGGTGLLVGRVAVARREARTLRCCASPVATNLLCHESRRDPHRPT